MKQQEKFYDVYVSYPPGVDRERINACLLDNLPQNEAEDLIHALAERPQAIIAEYCTLAERENAQHYFNYLGLDVIVRHALELSPSDSASTGTQVPENEPLHQCPVCLSINEDSAKALCSVCGFHFDTTNEQTIQRKRIEWQEKLAFEHKRQNEIAHKLQQEREKEEKLLRKKIRAELEEKLHEELGQNPALTLIAKKRKNLLIGAMVAISMILLVTIGYLAAKFL